MDMVKGATIKKCIVAKRKFENSKLFSCSYKDCTRCETDSKGIRKKFRRVGGSVEKTGGRVKAGCMWVEFY
jgi:hypothetical protein